MTRTENSFEGISCSCPAWVLFHSWLTGRQHSTDRGWSTMRFQVSDNDYRGTECMNWFVTLALNHLSFSPSHIHMATSVPAGPALVLMQDTPSLACEKLFWRTLKAHLSLKASDLYTDSFTRRVMLSLCSPFPSAHQAAGPAAGRGTSTPLCRNMQGWLAGHGRAVLRTFPGCQHRGVAFWARQSQHVLSLLLPTQETAATSFFNPAQVRPDFPVPITIALFTFHASKGETPWLCWSSCQRRKL